MTSYILGLMIAWSTQATDSKSPVLRIHPRPPDAISGSVFARQIESMSPEDREREIWDQLNRGNVPDFLRQLVAVPVTASLNGRTLTGRIFVAPDYLAIGSNEDYFFVPMTPYTAQKIADRLRCSLPTPTMVDAIYAAASVKLAPMPIPPSTQMTTVPVFEAHSDMVWKQRQPLLATYPLGSLVAGDKKDIVICGGLKDHPNHVAIYGWHRLDGKPIQPLYLGHGASWADYSHGVRLIADTMEIDGKRISLRKVLTSPESSRLINSEGPIAQIRYRISRFPKPTEVKRPDSAPNP